MGRLHQSHHFAPADNSIPRTFTPAIPLVADTQFLVTGKAGDTFYKAVLCIKKSDRLCASSDSTDVAGGYRLRHCHRACALQFGG